MTNPWLHERQHHNGLNMASHQWNCHPSLENSRHLAMNQDLRHWQENYLRCGYSSLNAKLSSRYDPHTERVSYHNPAFEPDPGGFQPDAHQGAPEVFCSPGYHNNRMFVSPSDRRTCTIPMRKEHYDIRRSFPIIHINQEVKIAPNSLDVPLAPGLSSIVLNPSELTDNLYEETRFRETSRPNQEIYAPIIPQTQDSSDNLSLRSYQQQTSVSGSSHTYDETETSFIGHDTSDTEKKSSAMTGKTSVPLLEDDDSYFYFRINPDYLERIIPEKIKHKKRSLRKVKRRAKAKKDRSRGIIDAYDQSYDDTIAKSHPLDVHASVMPELVAVAKRSDQDSWLDNWSMRSSNPSSSAQSSRVSTVRSKRSNLHVHFEDSLPSTPEKKKIATEKEYCPVKNSFIVEKYLSDEAFYDDGRPVRETENSGQRNNFLCELNEKLQCAVNAVGGEADSLKIQVPRERFLSVKTLKILQETQQKLVEEEQKKVQRDAPTLNPVYF